MWWQHRDARAEPRPLLWGRARTAGDCNGGATPSPGLVERNPMGLAEGNPICFAAAGNRLSREGRGDLIKLAYAAGPGRAAALLQARCLRPTAPLPLLLGVLGAGG